MRSRPFGLSWLLCALAASAQVAPSQETGGDRVFAVLARRAFPERVALLEAVRDEVRLRSGGPRVEGLVAALEQRMREIEVECAPWLTRSGAIVTERLWLVPAFVVRVPPARKAELARCPLFADVQPIVPTLAHTVDATSAKNHNADWVQGTLGLTGAGVALGLVDSGIDYLCAGNGNNPHPAFDAAGPFPVTRIRKAADLDTNRQQPDDQSGHGTSVASIAVGSKRHWSIAIGGTPDDGFAPDADLLSYRIAGTQPGTADPVLVVKAWQQVLLDASNPAYPPLVATVHSFGGSPSPQDAAQMAMDACSIYADVLHVTSAGNSGSFLSPTFASQANCNGIAVGGCEMVRTPGIDVHRVWNDSSYGPLLLDPLRTFPDLVAACTNVSSAKLDAPAFMARDSGTSLAAPMVAGTALVLRAADRTLSAIDTKALLLAFTEDIGAVNPNRDRNHFGLGMLRADLAVRGLREGTLLRGTLVRDVVETRTFRVRLPRDRGHVATLCWARPDPYVEPRAWADLDLRVFDHFGRLVGVSASPRNLYEKVVWTAAKEQDFTIEVRGTGLPTDTVGFAIAVGPNLGEAKPAGAWQAVGTSCSGTGIDAARGVVAPKLADGAWGYDHTTQPFAAGPLRLQQAYCGEEFPAELLVTHLALRRDNEQAFTPGFTVDLEVRMGLTSKPPDALSAHFAANWLPGTEHVVYTNPAFRLSGTRGLTYDPARFDFTIPLQSPHRIKAGKDRHVLVEFRVKSNTLAPGSPPFYFDIEATRQGRFGRVVAIGNASATVGSPDPFGLAMSFVAAPYSGRAPDLQAPFPPVLGKPFEVVLRHAPVGAGAALVYGSQPALLRLDAYGAPGCWLYSDVVALVPTTVDAAGEGVSLLPVPGDASLLGASFHNQFLIADPAANALGLVLTNGGMATIGG